MAVADLKNESQEVITGNDNIVIVDNFQSIRGGRTLDTTGFTPEVINAGHVIIKEDATGEYKPLGVIPQGTDVSQDQDGSDITTEDAYAALPAGHSYAGILIASILTKRPFAGILVRGTVNPAAAPYPMTDILTAVKTALPLIDFRED
jgi:hypothetical protein